MSAIATGSEGWAACLLEDVVRLKRGYDLPTQIRRPGKVPVISSSGVSGVHDEAKVAGPGVVTGRYGTLGEVFFVSCDFWPLNTALYVEDFKGNDPRFASYLLRTLSFGTRSGAAAVPGVNRNDLHRLRVLKPPLTVQRRIASVLSSYDTLIENNSRRIAILEEMAGALYREWFIEYRFPGHGGETMVGSELGRIPAGWRTCKLSELAAVNTRSIRRGTEPSRVAYVDIASVSTGAIEAVQRMPFKEAPGRARRLARDGDTIWSCVRPNRRSFSLVLDPDPELVVSTGFAVLSPKAVPFGYFYQAVTTDQFTSYLTNHAQGAAYPAVTATTFENAVILKPEDPILDRFQEAIEPMLRLMETLRRENRNLRATRDFLLPKLVSGEICVSAIAETDLGIAMT